MASSTSIANMSLGHLGVSKKIANLTTESSAEARACREFFETDRLQTLRDFSWPFAATIAQLSVHQENPNSEWAFSYQYPSDCLNFRRILSGNRNPTRYGRIPHRIINLGGAKRVLTDMIEAEAEYTINVTDTNLFTPDFIKSLSFRLAASIAPQICGTNSVKMAQLSMQRYMAEIEIAQANARNEEQADIEPDSEYILVREGYISGFNYGTER